MKKTTELQKQHKLPKLQICNYGGCIRYRRLKLGISQEDLAEKAEVDRKTISRYERNCCSYNIETLNKIFKILGIEICKKCVGCKEIYGE